MGARKHIWIFGLIGVLVAATTAGAKDVIVPDDLAFILKEETWMTKSGQAAWHRRLRETPDITSSLLKLLWECFDSPTETLNGVVNALMYRDDIPPAELEKLSKTLRQLAESGPVSQLDADRRNLFSAMCVLQRAPNAENEDLALLLLECDDSIVRSIAATTLGWIGTKRSIEPMRRHFDPSRYMDTDPPRKVTYHFQAEEMLLARVAGKPWDVASLPSSFPANTAKLMDPVADSVPEWIESRALPRVAITVALIASGWLLWLVRNNRK